MKCIWGAGYGQSSGLERKLEFIDLDCISFLFFPEMKVCLVVQDFSHNMNVGNHILTEYMYVHFISHTWKGSRDENQGIIDQDEA